jgi:hypothetical protein
MCENPFSDDQIKGDNQTIHGKVTAIGAPSSANIYVWLDVIDVGTFTDSNGEFILKLPPKSTLNATGSVTGDFDLYFYTINYSLVKKKLVIRDGSFYYNNGDVDDTGRVKNVSLVKTFNAETHASFKLPEQPGYQYGLSTTAHFTAKSNNFEINIPNGSMILLGGILIIDLESGEVYKHQLASGKNNDFIARLTSQEKIWSFHPNVGEEIVLRRDYQIVPYIFPYYPDLPAGLLESLGISEYKVDEKYLNLLFDATFATFQRPQED